MSLDEASKYSSIFCGFIGIIVTIILGRFAHNLSKKQNEMQHQQIDLAIFEKRWSLLKELEHFGHLAESKENLNNWGIIKHEIELLAERSRILFGDYVKEKMIKAADSYEKYSTLCCTIEAYDHPEDLIDEQKKEYSGFLNQRVKKYQTMIKDFDIAHESLLSEIKKSKILKK